MIKVFDYIPELDAFKVTEKFKYIVEGIGLSEWNPVVWIGRLFILDNDYGEHWFDNWEAREKIRDKADILGYEADELLIIDPDVFKNDHDGPCNTPEIRKLFWTDVLKNLSISEETLWAQAVYINEQLKKEGSSEYVENFSQKFKTFV